MEFINVSAQTSVIDDSCSDIATLWSVNTPSIAPLSALHYGKNSSLQNLVLSFREP